MRILKWIGGILVLIVTVFLIGGYLLPQQVTVARSVEINATAGDVFPHVNSLKAAQKWSPWMERDPDVKTTYSGPDSGVGSKLAWSSEHPQVGNGNQEIILSEPDQRVETALDFGEMGLAKAGFLLEENAGVTTVTWTLDTDMGSNPVGRWMGLMMDRWVGADYELGLSNLKSLIEK